MNVTLYRKTVFEDVIKDFEMRRLSRWVLTEITGVFIRERQREI